MALTINRRFESLCPELSAEEYQGLEASIIDGRIIRDPIVVWQDQIIDGHNRYKIGTKHGIQWQVMCMTFASEDEAANWIIRNQLGRRNLSESQRAILAAKMVTTKKGSNQHSDTEDAHQSATTQQQAADAAHVSRRIVQQASTVVDTPLEKAVTDGKLTVKEAAAVKKLPEKLQEAFATGAVKGSTAAIARLAKADSQDMFATVRDARVNGKSLDEVLGMKPASKPKSAEKKPPKKQPAKGKGNPKVDVRKFSELETQVGKIVRMNTAIKEHCGGNDHHENIRQHLNCILKTLAAWRKEVSAA